MTDLASDFGPVGLGYLYTLTDPDQGIPILTIEVGEVRPVGGSLRALLIASTPLPGAKVVPHSDDRVLAAEVFLFSPRSREDYAQRLHAVIPDPPNGDGIDFHSVLEEVAQRTLAAEQADQPLVVLTPAMALGHTTNFLIDGILPVGKPTILYGAGGVGKSILAAYIAVSVQAGIPFLGQQVRQAEVLYLDWETDVADIAARVLAAAQGLGVAMPGVRYESHVRPIEGQVQSLARTVSDQNVELVIIDSVGMASTHGRDGSDPSEGAIRFFRSLRQLGVAVLAIDHVSGDDMRRGRAGAAKPYGSVYKWNSARNAFELRERKPHDLHGHHLLLKHRKSNLAKLQPDMALRLTWDTMSGTATFARETFEPVVSQPLPIQIMDILAVGPATPAKMAEFLSNDDTLINEIDVRREVKALIGAGKVTAGGDGQIRAVASSPAPDVSESEQLPLLDE